MSDRILIVDDDDNIQILLARLLTLEGIENVDVVSSGLEAIEYLASMRPSLVLLDVNMPGLDGWLVCEIINNVKRWKSIPVVFQTALQGSENIKRAVELGAHSYLEKPYTRESVRQVLDAVLNRNRVTDQSVGQDLQMILELVEKGCAKRRQSTIRQRRLRMRSASGQSERSARSSNPTCTRSTLTPTLQPRT